MKGLKTSLVLVAAVIMIIGLYGTSYAFHEGGVAYCEGCHTMHNSLNGAAISTNGGLAEFKAGPYLLKGSDQSSTCLNCHAANDTLKAGTGDNGYHIMSTTSSANAAAGFLPAELTPGGDFAWMKMGTLSATATYGAPVSNPSDRHGHAIVASDFGLMASTRYAANGNVSPGGSYPVANLYCSSCHDPHSSARIDSGGAIVNRTMGAATGPIVSSGSYGAVPAAGETVGVYRFLGSTGYLPDSVGGVAPAFTNNPPIAVAPAKYNTSEASINTRVAYGSGMSEWCSNCHAQIHNPNYPTTLEHPTGSSNAGAKLSNTDSAGISIAAKYNAYVKSGDLTGVQATSYTSMVPFEEGSSVSRATLASHAGSNSTAAGSTAGPSGGENVMCLSCHRAHASAWPEILRWNATKGEFLTVEGAYPGIDGSTSEQQGGQFNMGYTQAQVQRAFYERPATTYASYQRSLCNKCHAKD